MAVREEFTRIARWSANAFGSAWAFIISVVLILIWGALGPMYHFSDSWQLVMSTGTSIITLLMVFLIQNTQNRDSKAIHLKLDELIRALEAARTELVDLETLPESKLEDLAHEFKEIKEKASEATEAVEELTDEQRTTTEAVRKSQPKNEPAKKNQSDCRSQDSNRVR